MCYEGNGGGSGYVNFTQLSINTSVELTISVGKSGESTSVESESGESLIEAKSGEDGSIPYAFVGGAGSGYSGGGGAGQSCLNQPTKSGGDGGCNGSSGQRGHGTGGTSPGHGSGFQIDNLPFQMLSVRSVNLY